MQISWKYKTIKEIAEITMGQSPQSKFYNAENKGMPFLQGNKTFGDKYPYYDTYTTSHKKIAKENEVLMSVRAPVGDLNIAKEDICIGRGLCSLKMKNNQNEFLYYLLKSQIPKITNMATGTVFTSINKKDIENFRFKIPNTKIQKQVTYVLKKIDDKIENTKQLNSNLESQLELVFINNFVLCDSFVGEDFISSEWCDFPVSWDYIKLDDIISITSGDRPDEKSDYESGDFNIPLFGASKIMGYVNKYTYDGPILIIGRVGTHGVVQRVNTKCFPSDNTFVIKSKYYGYVYQILKRIDYESLNVGSTQPLITQKSLKNIKIPLPPKLELEKFEKLSKIYFEQIDKNNMKIKLLEQIRDILLPKLMSGEIDVSKIKIK